MIYIHRFFTMINVAFYVFLCNRLMQKVKFVDMFGNAFFLQKGDEVDFYVRRKSITDAINIISYLYKNKNKFSVQLDFGCNMGAVSVAMWKCSAENGIVYSLDADPKNVSRCKENIQLNGFPIDHITYSAISDHDGEVSLRIYENINGWQTVFGAKEYNESYKNYHITVPSITFESFIKVNNIDRIDFMKIDIEGMEYELIVQMHEFLAEKKIEEVVFELNQVTLESAGKTTTELLALWNKYDYTLHLIQANGELAALSAGIVPEQMCCDILARAN